MEKKAYIIYANLSIFFMTGVSGALIQTPLNAATSVGGQTVFDCSSDFTDDITWMYTTDCNTVGGNSLTVGNCDINSNYTSHYRTEKPGGFVCNLLVFDALLSLGGCYACADGYGTGNIYQAMLIVVDSNANITGNSTDLIPEEGAMISTSVSYSGPWLLELPPPMPPAFYWTLQSDPTQNITSYKGLTTNTSAASYIVVTAQPPNVPAYICHLFFNAPVIVPTSCADNTPTFRRSWTTPTYPVFYNFPPKILTTSHFESNICEAKILFCQPDAYPPAETYWVDAQQNVNIYQQDITAEYMDEYSCVATNFYRESSHETTITYSLSDRDEFSQTPCQFAETDKLEIILPNGAWCDNFTCTCSCCNEAVLKCSAATLPEAEYRWLFGETETDGPTIKPMADGDYICIAYNTVNNQSFSGNMSISILQFNEFLPNCPANDETVVIVLCAFLAFFILIVIGLVSWILFWLLPKVRAIPGIQGSTPSRPPIDSSSPQAAYENVVGPTDLPETSSPYESLQEPTPITYQELKLRPTRQLR